MTILTTIEDQKKTSGGLLACPISSAIDIIGGKWKVVILYQLQDQTLRFGELMKLIPKVSQKMLTQQLRELEKDNLVHRHVYAEIPPRVEYRLTDSGKALKPIMDALCQWASQHHISYNK